MTCKVPKQIYQPPAPRVNVRGIGNFGHGGGNGNRKRKLLDETCPNCGAELTCLEVRQPTCEEEDDLEPGDMVVYYTCFDCNWRGHVSEDTDEILWEEIYRD